LAYSSKRSKNYNKGKSGRKDCGLMIGKKKGVVFSARGIAKMSGKEAVKKKEERKGLIVKLKCNNFYQRKLY
jgi:hypothetical protein